LKRLMEINPTYCLTIEIVPFRNSDLLVAYGSLIREVRQAARRSCHVVVGIDYSLVIKNRYFVPMDCQVDSGVYPIPSSSRLL
jgi:hypothetical protein